MQQSQPLGTPVPKVSLIVARNGNGKPPQMLVNIRVSGRKDVAEPKTWLEIGNVATPPDSFPEEMVVRSVEKRWGNLLVILPKDMAAAQEIVQKHAPRREGGYIWADARTVDAILFVKEIGVATQHRTLAGYKNDRPTTEEIGCSAEAYALPQSLAIEVDYESGGAGTVFLRDLLFLFCDFIEIDVSGLLPCLATKKLLAWCDTLDGNDPVVRALKSALGYIWTEYITDDEKGACAQASQEDDGDGGAPGASNDDTQLLTQFGIAMVDTQAVPDKTGLEDTQVLEEVQETLVYDDGAPGAATAPPAPEGGVALQATQEVVIMCGGEILCSVLAAIPAGKQTKAYMLQATLKPVVVERLPWTEHRPTRDGVTLFKYTGDKADAVKAAVEAGGVGNLLFVHSQVYRNAFTTSDSVVPVVPGDKDKVAGLLADARLIPFRDWDAGKQTDEKSEPIEHMRRAADEAVALMAKGNWAPPTKKRAHNVIFLLNMAVSNTEPNPAIDLFYKTVLMRAFRKVQKAPPSEAAKEKAPPSEAAKEKKRPRGEEKPSAFIDLTDDQ